MLAFQEKKYASKIPAGKHLLAADIGGTNSTFAFLREHKIREEKSRLELLCSLRFASKDIADFPAVVQQVLGYAQQKWKITASIGCFAGAGPVSETQEHCKITHLPWDIDAKKVTRATKLAALVINDFEAVAYGIGELGKKDFLLLKKGAHFRRQKPKAVIGAGTGLGKSLLVWNGRLQRYTPLASEGGHGDLAILRDDELGFIHFMKKRKQEDTPEQRNIAWEDAVSGKGITNLYLYLGETRYYNADRQSLEIKLNIEKSGYEPAVIAEHASHDAQCREAMLLFLRFCARAAKNFALDTLPLGGIYLAGGIAAKNYLLFKRKEFIGEFLASKKQRPLLEKIPIYLVKNYDVSLYGAGRAALLWRKKGGLLK